MNHTRRLPEVYGHVACEDLIQGGEIENAREGARVKDQGDVGETVLNVEEVQG